jgi:hypothetical protein
MAKLSVSAEEILKLTNRLCAAKDITLLIYIVKKSAKNSNT